MVDLRITSHSKRSTPGRQSLRHSESMFVSIQSRYNLVMAASQLAGSATCVGLAPSSAPCCECTAACCRNRIDLARPHTGSACQPVPDYSASACDKISTWLPAARKLYVAVETQLLVDARPWLEFLSLITSCVNSQQLMLRHWCPRKP